MKKQKKLRPPVKTHGGKFYISSWIISHFPPNYNEMTYCEPFCGGGSVLLNKESSAEEVVSDLDRGLICIYKALRDEPKEFIGKLKKIKYSENTFKRMLKQSSKSFDDYIKHATNEFVIRRMSRGGLRKNFAWSDRERGGQPGDVNAWETMIQQLPTIAQRIQDLIVLNENAIKIIKTWDDDNCLIYLDPPYLPSTRVSQEIYQYDMTIDDHIALLNSVKNARSKVLISGYYSSLYKNYLIDWKCVRKSVANHASQQKTKKTKTECLWKNF